MYYHPIFSERIGKHRDFTPPLGFLHRVLIPLLGFLFDVTCALNTLDTFYLFLFISLPLPQPLVACNIVNKYIVSYLDS